MTEEEWLASECPSENATLSSLSPPPTAVTSHSQIVCDRVFGCGADYLYLRQCVFILYRRSGYPVLRLRPGTRLRLDFAASQLAWSRASRSFPSVCRFRPNTPNAT